MARGVLDQVVLFVDVDAGDGGGAADGVRVVGQAGVERVDPRSARRSRR